jgi:putative colanic acid biosynthesis UDP-glucose lipid carrier transferase
MNVHIKKDGKAEGGNSVVKLKVVPLNASQTAESYHYPVYQKLFRDFDIRVVRLSSVLPLDNSLGRMGKRTFDIVVSLLAVVLIFSWLLPIIALLIKLDSKGPVFFKQKRTGLNGKLFTCIKFRTMIVNAEADLLPATENDRRITRFGKFLRNRYLDELPQLLNVLMGDMSLIGPRPHMLSDDLRYRDDIEFYHMRYKVKPGITGLAQVFNLTGPLNELSQMKERVQLDIFYVRHWSLLLDVKILLRTLHQFFRS